MGIFDLLDTHHPFPKMGSRHNIPSRRGYDDPSLSLEIPSFSPSHEDNLFFQGYDLYINLFEPGNVDHQK
jgi:hypothetical protein